jgi:K+:H+ antiporter
MPHHSPLISTIVIALALAWMLGALAHRLRLPPIVGYLLAGVLIGPATPGFVADQTLASELAEIGVILLMFGVGLHFSLEICSRLSPSLCLAQLYRLCAPRCSAWDSPTG